MLPAAYQENLLDEPRKTSRRCPKCGSRSFKAIEHWRGATATFEFDNGVCRKQASLDDVSGIEPYRVEAECECGHAWFFKSATSIDDIQQE